MIKMNTMERNLAYVAKLDLWGDGKEIIEMPLRVSKEDLDLLELCSWNFVESTGRLQGKKDGKTIYLKKLIEARFDTTGLTNDDPCDLRREAWVPARAEHQMAPTAERLRDAKGKSIGVSTFEGRYYTWMSASRYKTFNGEGLPIDSEWMVGLCYATLEEAKAAREAMWIEWQASASFGRDGGHHSDLKKKLYQAALEVSPNVLHDHIQYR